MTKRMERSKRLKGLIERLKILLDHIKEEPLDAAEKSVWDDLETLVDDHERLERDIENLKGEINILNQAHSALQELSQKQGELLKVANKLTAKAFVDDWEHAQRTIGIKIRA